MEIEIHVEETERLLSNHGEADSEKETLLSSPSEDPEIPLDQDVSEKGTLLPPQREDLGISASQSDLEKQKLLSRQGDDSGIPMESVKIDLQNIKEAKNYTGSQLPETSDRQKDSPSVHEDSLKFKTVLPDQLEVGNPSAQSGQHGTPW